MNSSALLGLRDGLLENDLLSFACCCCCCCCCRYPAPSWWQEVVAFIPENPAKAAGYQPDSFVVIKGKKYQLASIPTHGSKIVVDVTKAPAGSGVAVGDSVCILCDQHSLEALAKVGSQHSYTYDSFGFR